MSAGIFHLIPRMDDARLAAIFGREVCPKCGGSMKVIAFITDFGAVDRIVDHLGLTFVADKPPPSHVFEQAALRAAEEREGYF